MLYSQQLFLLQQREPGAISSATGSTNTPQQSRTSVKCNSCPFSSVTPFSNCSAESPAQSGVHPPGAALTDAFAPVGELGGNLHEPPLVHAHPDQGFVHPSDKLTFSHKHVERGSPVIAREVKVSKNVSGSFSHHSTIFLRV